MVINYTIISFVTIISVKAYVFDARFEKAFETDMTVRAKRALAEAGIVTPDRAYRDLDLLGGERQPDSPTAG